MDDAEGVGVPIKASEIYWSVKPVLKEAEGGEQFVELLWGWTAGWSQERIDELAEDCPKGSASVKMSLAGARALRDRLDALLGD